MRIEHSITYPGVLGLAGKQIESIILLKML